MEENLIRESELELDEDGDYDPQIVADMVEYIAGTWAEADSRIVRPVTRMP